MDERGKEEEDGGGWRWKEEEGAHGGRERARQGGREGEIPSETACLASSPGRWRRTAVWISREVITTFSREGEEEGET